VAQNGANFTVSKVAQTLGYVRNFQANCPMYVDNRPMNENSHNLVTLTGLSTLIEPGKMSQQ
jgi:hypothetical protein